MICSRCRTMSRKELPPLSPATKGAVAEAERTLLRRKPPANLTAFDTYLLAMEAKHKVTKESLIEAEGLFRKALELDPQLARAYVRAGRLSNCI